MISVGTDIVKVSRIKKLLNNKRFIHKIFSKKEIEYCLLRPYPELSFSGKFACKEAVKKALYSSGRIKHIPTFKYIRIMNKKDSSPFVEIANFQNIDFSISISHEKDYAIAFVHADIKCR
tara:strand:+ start:92 stop:451 length:360 start_codon:yes stop_codon:yes gene_type:complete